MAYVPEIWAGDVTALPIVGSMGQSRILVWPLYATPDGQAATLLPSRWPQKGASASLDFVLDLTGFLDADGDTISEASCEVDDDDLTVGAQSHTDSTVTVWLSGGADLTDYLLTWTILTAGNRSVRPTVRLMVVPDNQADLYLTDGAGNILLGPGGDILSSE